MLLDWHLFPSTSVMSSPKSPDGAGTDAPCQPSSSVESSGYTDTEPRLLAGTRSSLLARRLMRLQAYSSHFTPVTRRKREMIPDDKKDASYWDKRRKNNEAAKRSREKRRLNDLMIEGQLLALSEENAQLRAQVLNLQYISTLSIEKTKAPSPSATSTAPVLAPTLPSSPIPPHTPSLFQAGIRAVRQQETALNQYESKLPCFGSTRGLFNPLSHRNCGTQPGILPLTGSGVLSLRDSLGSGRSGEVGVDAQRQVSSVDVIPISPSVSSPPVSSFSAIMSSPDTLHHASALSYPPQNWLVPQLNHSAVCNNLLLPWRSSYLASSAVYSGLPLHLQERQSQGVCVEAHIQRGLKSRFSSATPGLSQLGMHLSSGGRWLDSLTVKV